MTDTLEVLSTFNFYGPAKQHKSDVVESEYLVRWLLTCTALSRERHIPCVDERTTDTQRTLLANGRYLNIAPPTVLCYFNFSYFTTLQGLWCRCGYASDIFPLDKRFATRMHTRPYALFLTKTINHVRKRNIPKG